MRGLNVTVCAVLWAGACATDAEVSLSDAEQAQDNPAGKARTIYDGLYTLEEMKAALTQPEQPCSEQIESRLNCAVESYEYFLNNADQLAKEAVTRPFLVSDLLRLVYAIELDLIFSGHEDVSREAFIRHYWSFVITKGKRPGLYPGEMLEYLSSFQAWWHLINRHPDELRILIQESKADRPFEALLYNQRLQNGATAGKPISWANWSAGSQGYADLLQARSNGGLLAKEPLPLLYRYCSESGDYVFAIVTWNQDELLEAPSTVNQAEDPECSDSEMVTPLIYRGQVLP